MLPSSIQYYGHKSIPRIYNRGYQRKLRRTFSSKTSCFPGSVPLLTFYTVLCEKIHEIRLAKSISSCPCNRGARVPRLRTSLKYFNNKTVAFSVGAARLISFLLGSHSRARGTRFFGRYFSAIEFYCGRPDIKRIPVCLQPTASPFLTYPFFSPPSRFPSFSRRSPSRVLPAPLSAVYIQTMSLAVRLSADVSFSLYVKRERRPFDGLLGGNSASAILLGMKYSNRASVNR